MKVRCVNNWRYTTNYLLLVLGYLGQSFSPLWKCVPGLDTFHILLFTQVSKEIQITRRTRQEPNLVVKNIYISAGKYSTFSIIKILWIVGVILQLSLISFIFTTTKTNQSKQVWMSLMVPRCPEGRWYKLKMQRVGIQCKCTKVNFNKAAQGLVLLFYHLLASALSACWELSHLFHHTHPAT